MNSMFRIILIVILWILGTAYGLVSTWKSNKEISLLDLLGCILLAPILIIILLCETVPGQFLLHLLGALCWIILDLLESIKLFSRKNPEIKQHYFVELVNKINKKEY